MISLATRLLAAFALSGALALPALAAEPPQTSHDGLELRPSKNVELLYTRPGASLTPYTKIAILDCFVAFRKNWQRDQNDTGIRVTGADMERIKKNLAGEFRKVFSEELSKGGYTIVEEAGEDVLILRPAIIDLDVSAPDTMDAGRGRTFSTSAGAMTLYLELYDGATEQIIARAIDRRKARDQGFMTWQNVVTNRAEADRMLRKWADLARQGLDNAKAASQAP